MKPKFMPANQFARGKATRIPEAIWNDHKAEIITQYRRGLTRNGMAMVMEWIENLNDPVFKPTQRQVRSQLERWDVKANHEFNDALSAATSTASPDADSLATLQSQSARSGSSDTALTEFDDASNSSKSRKVFTALENFGLPKFAQIGSNVVSRKRPRKPSGSTKSESREQQREQIKTIFTLSRPVATSSEAVSTFLEPETDIPYMSIPPERLRTTLKKIGISISHAQMDELISGTFSEAPFTAEQRREIEEAAHFFGVLQIDCHAFGLYFILWLLHADAPPTSERRLRLLRSCAMAANSSSDLRFIHELLQHEVERIGKLDDPSLELFLLRIILTFISRKSVGDHSIQEDWVISDRLFKDLQAFMTKLHPGVNDLEELIGLDLNSYYVIDFALQRVGRRRNTTDMIDKVNQPRMFSSKISSELLKAELLRQWSVTADSQGASSKVSGLRSSLEWCRETLTTWNWVVGLPWELMMAQKHLEGDASDLIGLYWLLWSQWQNDRESSGNNSFLSSEAERDMGISSSELLFELASLALRAIPREEKRSFASRFLDRDHFACLRRAFNGLDKLLKMPDAQLVEAFLAQVVHPSNSILWETSEALKSCSFRVFNTVIRKQAPPRDLRVAAPLVNIPAFRRDSCDPTMKSSDTGSTISSMRRHKDKVLRLSVLTERSAGRSTVQDVRGVYDISEPMNHNRSATSRTDDRGLVEGVL